MSDDFDAERGAGYPTDAEPVYDASDAEVPPCEIVRLWWVDVEAVDDSFTSAPRRDSASG